MFYFITHKKPVIINNAIKRITKRNKKANDSCIIVFLINIDPKRCIFEAIKTYSVLRNESIIYIIFYVVYSDKQHKCTTSGFST